MKRKFRCTAFIVAILPTIYVLMIQASPLPYRVMDRDHSGVVSFLEAFNARDIGKRKASNAPGCIEYFWLKDGMAAYEHCPDNTQAQPK